MRARYAVPVYATPQENTGGKSNTPAVAPEPLYCLWAGQAVKDSKEGR